MFLLVLVSHPLILDCWGTPSAQDPSGQLLSDFLRALVADENLAPVGGFSQSGGTDFVLQNDRQRAW